MGRLLVIKQRHIFGILLLAGLQAPSLASAQVGEALQLSSAGQAIAHPALASRSFSTTLAWTQAASDGVPRLHQVSLMDGQMDAARAPQRVRPVDPETPGADSWPAVAYDPMANRASLLWIRQHQRASRLLFRTPQGPTETITTSENVLDLPALVFDEQGTAYAAWTETAGAVTQVRSAVRTDAGWEAVDLGASEGRFSLFPQPFGIEQGAELYWYEMAGGNFQPRAALLQPAAAATALAPPSELPATRLPLLYKTEAGALGAVWMEQTEFGELYLEAAPQPDGSYEFREIRGGDTPIAQITVGTGGAPEKAWIENPSLDSSILVLETAAGQQRFPVPPSADEPLLSQSANWRHLAWISEDLETGKSTLYYQRLPKNP